MTPDEFCALPPSLALRVLLQVSPGLASKLEAIECPKAPRAPKYDQPIYRKEGVQWASETDLEGLKYWCRRYRESSEAGGEYADKDAKRAKQLGYWIEWRAAYPEAVWSGARNDRPTTANPPSWKPDVQHAREARKGEAREPARAPAFPDDNPSDDIPF